MHINIDETNKTFQLTLNLNDQYKTKNEPWSTREYIEAFI
uniref:Uncharacterized protein n=1 Tax=Brassica campestris TaxID=3711 RepID=A0A3P6C1D5_BRACM|nr:unnamed protein product [Brassica rapa]